MRATLVLAGLVLLAVPAATAQTVVPPRKLVRFFQIDNKLDSVVRADISKQIPLAP